MNRIGWLVIAGTIWLGTTAALAQTQQMTNGSFEADPVPAVFPGYTTVFTGWSIGGGGHLRNDASGPFYTPSNGPIPDGSQIAGIQGGGGSLSQTLTGLQDEMQCNLSFAVCKRNTGDISLTVTLGTQTIYSTTVINFLPFTTVNIPTFFYDAAWGNTLTFTTSNPQGDATVLLDNVSFQTVPRYTITPSVNGGNGTISPSTPQLVLENDSQGFVMTPSPGFRIFDILINGARQAVPTPTYTFNSVTADQTITVSYALPDWTFDIDGYDEGWASYGQIASNSVSGGRQIYDINPGNSDPTVLIDQLSLPRASYNWLRIRAHNQTSGTGGRMYWHFGTFLTQARSVGYDINPNDTQVSEYWVNFNDAGTNWTNGTTVVQMRSDLPDAGAPFAGTRVEVDQITMLASGPPAPTVDSITRQNPASAGPFDVGSVTWDVRFSHSMDTVGASDFTVTATGDTSATVNSVTRLGPTWYRVSANVAAAGTGTLRLDAVTSGSGQDVAGQGLASGFTGGETYSIDRDAPGVTLASAAGDPVNGAISVTVTLTESVSTFGSGDVSLTNATLSGFSGLNDSYSFTLTPMSEGVFSCVVNAGAFTDGVGLANTASNAVSRTFDETQPTVALNTTAGALVNAAIPVTGSVSEPGTDFGQADLVPVNAVVQNFSLVGQNFSFDLLAQSDGAFSVSVPGGQFADAAGNNNLASSAVGSTFDGSKPGVTLSTGAVSPVNAAISVSVSISEPVTTFDASDLTLVNATVNSFNGSGDSYSFNLAPTAQGVFSVIVNADAFTDGATNTNTASNSISLTFDGVGPVILSRSPSQGATIGSLPSVQVTFNESVTGVTADDLTVGGSAATSVSGSGSGPYVFSGFAAPGDGSVLVSLSNGGISDAAGNFFGGTTWSYTVNTTVPTVTLTSAAVADGGTTNATGPIPFTVVFSEAVNGFTASDVVVSNAASPVTGFAGTGASYSFDVTPSSDGTVTVLIPNAAGTASAPPNNPSSASPLYSFTRDTTPPVITLNGGDTTKDCGAPYVDAGVASATDNVDGNLTPFVSVGGETVDEFTAPRPAPYVITYTVSDTAGNTTVEQREVTVTDNCPLDVSPAVDTLFEAGFGDNVPLNVAATGVVGGVNYDWQKDDGSKAFVSLGAPNSPTLLLQFVQQSNSGDYRCVVSDAVTTVTSGTITLTVSDAGLPVGGSAGLALLALLTAATGARMTRRGR